jgi:hypothetical protein
MISLVIGLLLGFVLGFFTCTMLVASCDKGEDKHGG